MKKPMVKRMLIMFMLIGIVFAAIVGYQQFVASMMKQFLSSNAQPPATVTAMQVKRELWQPQLKAVGSLRAIQGVDISSEIAGIIEKVHFKSGDQVEQGDLLLELSSSEERARLQALQAARKLAEINLRRDRQQYEIRAVSKARLDVAEAELAGKKAQVAEQQAIIDKKQIHAPFSGQLGVLRLSPGQYINPAEKIVTLQDNSALYVDFKLPQRHLGQLRAGQKITVHSHTDKPAAISGLITAINASVDPGSRNVAVEGLIYNNGGQLLPGMFVNITIDTGRPERLLTLPQTAVSFNAYGSTVFVATQEQQAGEADANAMPLAQQVFIKTGETRGDQVAILEGLSEGDMVVTSGQLKLKNGTPLIINNDILPANEAAPKPQEQ